MIYLICKIKREKKTYLIKKIKKVKKSIDN